MKFHLLKQTLETLVLLREELHDVVGSSELSKLDDVISELEEQLNNVVEEDNLDSRKLLKKLGEAIKYIPAITKLVELLGKLFGE